MKGSILLFLVGMAGPAAAGTIEESLLKLDPEERAHQVCILKGIDDLNRAKALPQVDRLKTSILSRAKFDGTTVTASGGAVRSKHRWFALTFTCTVTKDQMKATSFVYKLGPEIAREKWEDLGLWE